LVGEGCFQRLESPNVVLFLRLAPLQLLPIDAKGKPLD